MDVSRRTSKFTRVGLSRGCRTEACT
jgi:hypothetical protein